MNEVVVLSGAEQQVFGLYRRLEDNAEGLGDAFYSDFCRGCVRLSQFPEIAPRYRHQYRKLLLQKWQTGIFYSIQGSRIMISAVIDVRQQPETIRRYLDSL